VFNVPAGALTVTARFADTKREIKTVSGLARKNWVTYMQVRADQATRKPIN